MGGLPSSVGGILVIWHDTVGSTNEETLALARAGKVGPLFVVALKQTAGRGRRGRAWVSERGNLYASLLTTDPAPPAAAAQVCFVAALALHDAVLDCCAGLAPARLQIKWPNDLLLDGKKVAGILVEGMTVGGKSAVVIGFGVNCSHHPKKSEFPATDFAAAEFALASGVLLAALGKHWQVRAREWDRGENFASIRAAFLKRASGLNDPIEVRLAERSLSGTFEGLDERGALILRKADGGRETIAAGDVIPLVGVE